MATEIITAIEPAQPNGASTPAKEEQQPQSSHADKVPSSITRVYNVPVVKDTLGYADGVLRSYSASALVYQQGAALAESVYRRAGEPLQERLQGQINQLDGLANKGLDYVQGKAPYIFDAPTSDLLSTARKPADQAYSTARGYQAAAVDTARVYSDAVAARCHETLVASHRTLAGLQERLAGLAGGVPKSGAEAHDLVAHLVESLEAARDALLKQSAELPASLGKALQPYVEKLQKGAADVKSELTNKDLTLHARAQHIIQITREITAESLAEALEAVKRYTKPAAERALEAEHAAENGVQDAPKTAEEFVDQHTPGNVSYAEAVKE